MPTISQNDPSTPRNKITKIHDKHKSKDKDKKEEKNKKHKTNKSVSKVKKQMFK